MTCSDTEVACGYACLSAGECCVGGNYFYWGCTGVDAACYTVSNVVGCYGSTTTTAAAAPTRRAKCIDYEAYLSSASCPDDSECFYCTDVYRPSCATDYYVTGTRTLTRDLCATNSGTASYYASVDALYAEAVATSASGPTSVQTIFITQTPPPQSGELSGGAVAGIVVGVLAVLVLVGIAVFMVRRRRRRELGQGAAMHRHGEDMNAELDGTARPGVSRPKTGAVEVPGNSMVEVHGNSMVEGDRRSPASAIELDGQSVRRY